MGRHLPLLCVVVNSAFSQCVHLNTFGIDLSRPPAHPVPIMVRPLRIPHCMLYITTNGPPNDQPTRTPFSCIMQLCDRNGAFLHPYNCRMLHQHWKGVTDRPRVGQIGTNKFRTLLETLGNQRNGSVKPLGFVQSPTAQWTTPLRALTTASKSETLRLVCNATSTDCNRPKKWSGLAVVPASSSRFLCDPRSAPMDATKKGTKQSTAN